MEATKPNNGMHPTRVSVDVIRKVEGLFSCVRAGDAGRYSLRLGTVKAAFDVARRQAQDGGAAMRAGCW